MFVHDVLRLWVDCQECYDSCENDGSVLSVARQRGQSELHGDCKGHDDNFEFSGGGDNDGESQ